jgi:transcriptional regulator with XRE-family HTH domain
MGTPEAIGDRIRNRRRELGLHQQSLAGDGVTASYVSLIEAGKRHPSDQTIRHIATRLGVSPEYLLTGEDPTSAADQDLEIRFAELALANGDAADAERRFRSLLASALGEPTLDRVRWGLAASLESLGRLEEAIAAYEELRLAALCDPAGRPLLRSVTALSRCYREAGDLARAVDVADAAADRMSAFGLESSDLAVDMLCTVAFAHQERGDIVRAKQILARVRRLADDLGTPRTRGAAYWNASVLAGEIGATGEAVALAERALALFGEGDDERNLSRLRNAYATLLMRHDPSKANEALHLLAEARDALASTGSSVDVAYCETEMARALVLTGDPEAAVEHAVAALDRLGPDSRLEAPRARLALAYALAAAGHRDQAIGEYRGAAEVMEALGARRQAALAHAELGQALEAAGDTAGALAAAYRALTLASVAVPFPAPAERPEPARAATRR